jgi:hypothetical protein
MKNKLKENLIVFLAGYMSMIKHKDMNETYMPPTKDEAIKLYENDFVFHAACHKLFQIVCEK